MRRTASSALYTALVVVLLLTAVSAMAASPLDDNFNGATLDPKWTVTYMGDTQLQDHSVTVENGQLVLTGCATDIWDVTDNGIFVWQAATGDFRITLKLVSLEAPDVSAKLGIWVRQDMDTKAPNVLCMAMPKGVHMQARDTRGGTDGPLSEGRKPWTDDDTSDTNGTSPIWLRLTRTGDTFKQELSYDGTTWEGSHTSAYAYKDVHVTKMPRAVLVGIGFSSHNATVPGTAIVDDFTFEQLNDGPPAGKGFVVADAVNDKGNTQPGGVSVSRDGKVIGTGYSGVPFLVDAGPVTANAGGLFVKGSPKTGTVVEGKTLYLPVLVQDARVLVKDLATDAGQEWVIKLPADPAEDFSAPDASEADFQPYTVPSTDWDTIDPDDNIYGWIRTKVTVPSQYVGKDLWLDGWALDDEDWTYWNGTQIGHTNSWNTNRQYLVPGSLVQATNVLAIRGRDGTGAGGITPSSPKLVQGNPSVSITGQVIGADGKPVSNIPVRIDSPLNEWGGFSNVVITDAQGKYAAYAMGPGEFTVKVDTPIVVADPKEKVFQATGGQTVVQDFKVTTLPFFPDPVDTKASDNFAGTTLNSKWTSEDIGTTDPGDAVVSNNTLTISADGADFWDATDNGHIVYQKYSGDFVATVKVMAVPNTDGWSKAGIDVRTNNLTGSPHVFVCATRDNGYAFQGRNQADLAAEFSYNSGAFQPGAYLRIERVGTIFRGYWSPDGTTVNFLGQQDVPAVTSDCLVALAVTSHSAGNVGDGVFADFRIGGLPTAPPTPTVVKGDLSGDGKLGVNDAVLALQCAVGVKTATPDQLKAGDLNGDGKIGINEVTLILQAAVGLRQL